MMLMLKTYLKKRRNRLSMVLGIDSDVINETDFSEAFHIGI
jgi:hypothetical protein